MAIIILFLLDGLADVETEIVSRFKDSVKDATGTVFKPPKDNYKDVRLAMSRRGFIVFLYRILMVFVIWCTADAGTSFVTSVLWLSVALTLLSGVIVSFLAVKNAQERNTDGRTAANT